MQLDENGESLPVRKRLPHAVPQWVNEGAFFFITINCQRRCLNQLCRPGRGEILLSAAAYYHEHHRWHCRLMLLMPDHLHAIIARAEGARFENNSRELEEIPGP